MFTDKHILLIGIISMVIPFILYKLGCINIVTIVSFITGVCLTLDSLKELTEENND